MQMMTVQPVVAEDLRGAFLIAADLRGSNLNGTNLIGAD
ncbi:MAG: pentapeptide repeat-containing protein, partial [Bacillus sp. (in: firmicutes)]